MVKNEIPYPPPRRIIEAAIEGLNDVNRYPTEEEILELKLLISSYNNVNVESILIASGLDFLILNLLHLFSRAKGKILTIYPSFFSIANISSYLKAKVNVINLTPSFDLPLSSFFNEAKNSSLIFLDNPNNPTGKLLLEKEDIKELLELCMGIVLIDEAYFEFSKVTVADLVRKYENLIVLRTLSKAFGLAALRVGYAIGNEKIVKNLSSLPLTVSKPSIYAAIEALRYPKYAEDNVKRTISERERVRKELLKMGLKVYRSVTNFLMVNTFKPKIAEKLYQHRIKVLDLSRLIKPGYIRVSIGTKEENDLFLTSLRKLLQE